MSNLSIAAHDDLRPAKHLIVSDDIETRKSSIEKALRFKLLVTPVVASPMNQKRAGLSDRNPFQPITRLDAVDLAFKSELIVVSERLGHASVVLTLDTYSHVLPNMQQTATDEIERMLHAAS